MHVSERDLLEIPVVFVDDGERRYSYNRGYTTSGIPFYGAPSEKHNTTENSIEEFFFLPITNREFMTNTEDLFYGYRFILVTSGFTSMSLIHMPETAIVRIQLTYDINRIRYYPENEKTIIIDRNCDNLIPTQIVNLQFHKADIATKLIQVIEDILNSYCNFYLDKKL